MPNKILNGTIVSASDHNSEEILGGLPLKPRHQIVTIIIDENFWPILFMKGKKVKLSMEVQSGSNAGQIENNQINKAQS